MYVQGYIMSGVAMKVVYKFRRNMSEKIERMPLKYFDTKTHGEVLSRVTNDIDTISTTLSQNLTQMITSLVTIIGVIVMMLTISWMMTLVALVVLPVSFALLTLVIKASQKYFMEQQVNLGHVNGHVEEMYGGHNVMRAYTSFDPCSRLRVARAVVVGMLARGQARRVRAITLYVISSVSGT